MPKSKTSTQFVCNQCGYESVQWYGKCPNCGQWNTMVEFKIGKEKEGGLRDVRGVGEIKPQRLSEIKVTSVNRISSGIEELDRVLGGGFVVGEVVLLAGEPGVGKSTLLLKLGGFRGVGPSFAEASSDAKAMADKSAGKDLGDIIYVSGEESPEQIKGRAERLGVSGEDFMILAETNVEGVMRETSEMGESRGKLLIVDSIQTLWSEEIEGSPGSVSQVKGCTQRLIEFAKKNGITVVLIGQINKEGEIAGPMMLNHMVDCVLFLEGERFADLRLLRGLKNRFGPTDEVGVFKMTEKGMKEVKNPSELFLGEKGKTGEKGEVGEVTICAMEGTRPMLLEIQALVTQSPLAIPRRVANGVDYNKVNLLTAVLQKTLNLPLFNQDVFVKVGGGFKVTEPAADLGIALAIISSFKNKPINTKVCVFGEVGLLGEIRRVSGEEKRIKEATKLGFSEIVSSTTVKTLREAVLKF